MNKNKRIHSFFQQIIFCKTIRSQMPEWIFQKYLLSLTIRSLFEYYYKSFLPQFRELKYRVRLSDVIVHDNG